MSQCNGDVPVVIMCGGYGTRIRGVAEDLPKPLIPIGGRPILWHIMKLYSYHGFNKFILCLGYKSWLFKEFFMGVSQRGSDIVVDTGAGTVERLGEPSDDSWEVKLIDTGADSGTGGRLAAVKEHIKSEYFMLSYGDGVGAVDVSRELDELRASDNLGFVCGVHPTSRYGELEVSGHQVMSFAEKLPSASWVSGGFFAFRSEFLRYVPDDDPGHFFEHEPLRKLCADGKLGLFPHERFWMGMDTYREYTALNKMWESKDIQWAPWLEPGRVN